MNMKYYGILAKNMNIDSNIRHHNLRNMSVLHLFHFPISEGIDPAL